MFARKESQKVNFYVPIKKRMLDMHSPKSGEKERSNVKVRPEKHKVKKVDVNLSNDFGNNLRKHKRDVSLSFDGYVSDSSNKKRQEANSLKPSFSVSTLQINGIQSARKDHKQEDLEDREFEKNKF